MEVAEGAFPEIKLARGALDQDMPLADAVYTALRDAICDGRLEPNMKLPQIPLADHLGISRTPVRDALQRLAQEGLVRAVSFRGFVVSEFSSREVLDVYQVRIALEPMVVREAFSHYSRLTLAEMGDICDRMEATDPADLTELYDRNGAFHRTLIDPCPNRVAVRILNQLWQLPSSLRMFHAQASNGLAMQSSVAGHRAILEAIESGDKSLAVKRVKEHVQDAEKETIRVVDETR
jgi:DNA-binding GntR family transcriptional regulator